LRAAGVRSYVSPARFAGSSLTYAPHASGTQRVWKLVGTQCRNTRQLRGRRIPDFNTGVPTSSALGEWG